MTIRMKEIRLKEEDFGAESEWTRKCPHCDKTLLSPIKGWNAQQELQKLGDHRLDGLTTKCDCLGAVAERKEREEAASQEEEMKKNELDKKHFAESGMPESWRERRLAMWQEETEQRRDALRKVTAYGQTIPASCISLAISGRERRFWRAVLRVSCTGTVYPFCGRKWTILSGS